MDPLAIIILALATWRMASLLADEDGPFDVFARLRLARGVEYDQQGQPYVPGGSEVAFQVICLWCNSLWVGLAWTLLYFFIPSVAPWLAMPFALSAVACGIHGRGVRFRKTTR